MRPFLQDNDGRLTVQPTEAGLYPEHLHSDVELLYLFEGETTLTVDGQPQHMRAGDLCICFPSVVHGYAGGRNARALMLIFPPEFSPDFPALLTHSYPQNPLLRGEQLPPDVAICMQQLLLEREHGFDPAVLRGYIQVVLARTLPLLTLARRAPEISDIVYDILKYLSQHYREPVTLSDLSRALGVSKSYLSHSFSQRIGVNFRTYVNTLRADHACLLLRNSDEAVMNIAYECGFESQRTFNRVFMEQYGVSPSEYRRHQTAQ